METNFVQIEREALRDLSHNALLLHDFCKHVEALSASIADLSAKREKVHAERIADMLFFSSMVMQDLGVDEAASEMMKQCEISQKGAC